MMQIDRIALSKKDVKIRVGSSKFDQKYLANNEKLIDYEHGRPCPVCKMIMDVGEKGECSNCLTMFCKEGDTDE